MARGADHPGGAAVGLAGRSRRSGRPLRRLRTDRRVPDQGGDRLQTARRDRARRRAPEDRARVLRPVAARPDGRRANRLRRVLPRRRTPARRLNRGVMDASITIWLATHRVAALNDVFVGLGTIEKLGLVWALAAIAIAA